MEENVALDSSKQKQFVKSIKGIKKLIKKKDASDDQPKELEGSSNDKKVSKRKRKPRGLVYLGHIPHGFYENEMTQYFKQFGVVTNVRVIRSKRTGNSKGFAFVEFRDPAVAEIVAETMNNYLMGKRLIKAAYIPPEKQRYAVRKHWSSIHNPGAEARLKQKKNYNAPKTDSDDMKKARKLLSNFLKTKKKLTDMGINYDFFTPVDIPEGLSLDPPSKLNIKEEKPSIKNSNNTDSEKGKKAQHTGNYIRIKKDEADNSEDTDSSYAFDSDEFDKMLQNEISGSESNMSSGEESEPEEELDEDSKSEEEIVVAVKEKVVKKQQNIKKGPTKQQAPATNKQAKRKTSQNAQATVNKKSKFENKNTQKLAKKQFKKTR